MSRSNKNISENGFPEDETSEASIECDSRVVSSANVNSYGSGSALPGQCRQNGPTCGNASLGSRFPSSSRATGTSRRQEIVQVPSNIDDNAILTYPSSQRANRKMLLINITFRGTRDYRSGAIQDENGLVSVFTNLGFDICKHRDLNRDEMMSRVKDFRDQELKSSPDVVVVAIMSHGRKHNAISNTSIVTIDEQMVDAEDILDLFNRSQCKAMAGKPKIFIFQCCRGEHYQSEVDSVPLTPKAPVTDALVAYSTLPGFVSYRHREKGSCYITTLCEVFTQYAHKHHVEDLLKIVDNKLAEMKTEISQTAYFENRGFNKHCYLTPTVRK